MSRRTLGRCRAGERKRVGARGRVGDGRTGLRGDGWEHAGRRVRKHLLTSAVEELAHARRAPPHKHFHEVGA